MPLVVFIYITQNYFKLSQGFKLKIPDMLRQIYFKVWIWSSRWNLKQFSEIQSKVTRNKCDFFYNKKKTLFILYIPFVCLLQKKIHSSGKRKYYFIILSEEEWWTQIVNILLSELCCLSLLIKRKSSIKHRALDNKRKIKTNQHISERNYCNLNHIWGTIKTNKQNANYT